MNTIKFKKENNKLILIYTPENGINWINEKIDKTGTVCVKNTFSLNKEKIYRKEQGENEDDIEIEFVIGYLEHDYYKVTGETLRINQDIFLFKDLKINQKHFIAYRDISIFSKIANLTNEDIYIGGNQENALPADEMDRLIREFPNSTETRKYVDSRISVILRDYFDNVVDAKEKYNIYMNKKISIKGINLIERYKAIEREKYEFILEKLKNMLASEDSYNEKQWQEEIFQILQLLFPKYIHCLKEVEIKIPNDKKKRLDFLLVDSTGNIDIVEIKKPDSSCIVTESHYRDNYIPKRELSGTVMQIEKYIFHLNKGGENAENQLTKICHDQLQLPKDFRIKITNPSGIIIMGQGKRLSEEQLDDFEIIKRKYKNVIDIITYDDLINRLKIVIEQFK